MSDDTSLGPPWTILKILRWTTGYFEDRGVDGARLDAELLLAHVLDIDRIQLYTQFDRPLTEDELGTYRGLVKRRAKREPCAYLLGARHFWSLELSVDPRVLIPRPDTETLVRVCLEKLEEYGVDEESPPRLVDVGTGSGAVALAIASERPELDIAATDNSADALDVARKNAQSLALDESVHFFEGDLLQALPEPWLPLDFIVSNPPYIADGEREEIQAGVRDFEPSSALFAGPDGLDVIRRLITEAREALVPGGFLLFEIGHRQGKAVRELLCAADLQNIEIVPDYGDRDRVAVAQTPSSQVQR